MNLPLLKKCDTHIIGNSIIVFVATCNAAQRLAFMLRNLGFPALPIHGKMDQAKRLGALNSFKTGDRNILLATDVASRGLDIPSVDLILNYDIPLNPKVQSSPPPPAKNVLIWFVINAPIGLYPQGGSNCASLQGRKGHRHGDSI